MSFFRSVGRAALGSVNGQRSSARNAWASGVNGAATLANAYTRKEYYGLLWHFYLNTAYIRNPRYDPFQVVSRYLAEQRLYPNLRGIYNPVTRLTNAYVASIVGGKLDPLAGDGTVRRTALPILTEHENLRQPISKLWQWSNFDIKKALAPRFGAATGNFGIRLVDDPERGQVRFEIVPAWEVTDVQLDGVDNVIYWRQEYPYEESDEQANGHVFTSVHTFALEIDKDEFRTYRDGLLYGFAENNGQEAWPNPYGFVPALWVKHIDTGTDLGLCAYHASIPVINTLNEVASHLAEQVKKSVHPQWFVSGATEPKSGSFLAGLKVWWSPNDNARAQVLNDKLDIGGVVLMMKDVMEELEKSHPLLNFYVVRNRIGSGDLTGRAVHTMLYDIEHDVNEAQMPYDSAWVRAHKMAISIGGFRQYDGFEAFDLENSYLKGDLDHSIGPRPLIPLDEEQELALATQTGALLGTYIKAEKDSGLPTSALVDAIQRALAQIQSGVMGSTPPEITLLDPKIKDMVLNPPLPVIGGKPPLPGTKPAAKKPSTTPVVSRQK